MAITKFRPWHELDEIKERMNTLFEDVFRGITPGRFFNKIQPFPAVELSETEKEYILKAELPGLKKEDFEVEVEDRVVRIRGEKKEEKEAEEKNSYYREIYQGSFVRSFRLPEDADPESAEAEFKDGLLKVRFKKLEGVEKKAKKIEIK